jgi:hypothetical protein
MADPVLGTTLHRNTAAEAVVTSVQEQFHPKLEAGSPIIPVLAERWRVHYNTIRPHSSLGYRPPAPEARRTNDMGHGEVETATRFPLLHTPDGGYLNSEIAAIH